MKPSFIYLPLILFILNILTTETVKAAAAAAAAAGAPAAATTSESYDEPSFPVASSRNKKCPPAPRKGPTLRVSSINQNYTSCRNLISSKQLTPIGQGDYKDIYLELTNNDPSNSTVYKFYRQDRESRYFSVWTRNAIAQYNWAIKIGIGCAVIKNLNSVEQDGYFACEYVPYGLDQLSFLNKGQNDLTEEEIINERRLLDYLSDLFVLAINSEVALDLSVDNLRVDKYGRVLLVDFKEEKEDRGGFVKAFLVSVYKESWAKTFPNFASKLLTKIQSKAPSFAASSPTDL
ncbi:MAG: hypothetical protein HQK53_07940 [Oligoflexia bacterium]|nr:hypothetical protein [Oligoflexia bacterium]